MADDTPGAELFRSEREFLLTAYSAPHTRQLLLCAFKDPEPTRIDVLFRPVKLMKVRSSYRGLRISYATEEQAERIRADAPGVAFDFLDSFLVLETAGGADYVVAHGCAWHEDDREPWEAGHFAEPVR
ncbi:hypothetical protein ACSNOI_45910 [Actinomadura kijaniata]|uniref:hypothetical protein n=1 Tax=Actinomadura kijaniata TaxID=46161 RepID=UPI003F1D6214